MERQKKSNAIFHCAFWMTAQALFETKTIQHKVAKGPRLERAKFVVFESRVIITADFYEVLI